MIFSSPAKINKGFNVIKKRSDGFHDIETNFQFLETRIFGFSSKLDVWVRNSKIYLVEYVHVDRTDNLGSRSKVSFANQISLNFRIQICLERAQGKSRHEQKKVPAARFAFFELFLTFFPDTFLPFLLRQHLSAKSIYQRIP